MRIAEQNLVQDLLVAAVVEDGHDLVVSIYGGTRHVCGVVRFSFPDVEARAASLSRLQRWVADDETVCLLSYEDELVLLSERSLVERGLRPDTAGAAA